MRTSDFIPPLLSAVWEASRCCEAVSAAWADSDAESKSDDSPVTIADYASQALLTARIREVTPDTGIVAEEAADALRDQPERVERIASFTSRFNPAVNASTLLDLIDHGSHTGGEGTFWTLDPIDGTKGYLRGGQYAIALALVEKGSPALGFLGCPRYTLDSDKPGLVFTGGEGIPAQCWTSETASPRRVQTCSECNVKEARLCESRDPSHTAHDLSAKIIKDLGMSGDVLRIDSQVKYAAVAHGAAALYLRLPVAKGYREKIWDHAAGMAVIEAAGGRVSDLNGKKLDFSLGTTLAENRGVIASNGTLHHPALAALLAHTPEASRWE